MRVLASRFGSHDAAKSGLHLQPARGGVGHFAEPLRRDRALRMTNRKYQRLFSYLEAQRARILTRFALKEGGFYEL